MQSKRPELLYVDHILIFILEFLTGFSYQKSKLELR